MAWGGQWQCKGCKTWKLMRNFSRTDPDSAQTHGCSQNFLTTYKYGQLRGSENPARHSLNTECIGPKAKSIQYRDKGVKNKLKDDRVQVHQLKGYL